MCSRITVREILCIYIWKYNYTKSCEILKNYYNYTGGSVGEEARIQKQ